MELRSRNSVHAFALVFILGFTSTTTVADNAKEPAESSNEDSKSEKTQEISSDFPSFSVAYENDLPFSVRLPKANLQTEGFTINDNPRNFVAETFTRVAPPAPAEEEKEEEPSETTDAKSGKRRFKRGIFSNFPNFISQLRSHFQPQKTFLFDQEEPHHLYQTSFQSAYRPTLELDNVIDVDSSVREPRQIPFGLPRRPHQASRPRPPKRGRPGPTYPPFDPFGTTSYIPLPGTSRPEFALPLQRPGSHKGPPRGRLTKPSEDFFFGRKKRHPRLAFKPNQQLLRSIEPSGSIPANSIYEFQPLPQPPTQAFKYQSSEDFINSDDFYLFRSRTP